MDESRYRIVSGNGFGIPKPRYRRASGKKIGGAGSSGVPPMPEGFSDQTAWAAIHFKFSGTGSLMDQAVISWQKENQNRVKAAIKAKEKNE